MALKGAQIMDFCDTLSGFVDYEYTVDRGFPINFVPDSELFMSGSSGPMLKIEFINKLMNF